MERIKHLIETEPALFVGVVLAGLGLLSAFGFQISQEQAAAVVSFVGALLALAGAVFTRDKVMPISRVGRSRRTSSHEKGEDR